MVVVVVVVVVVLVAVVVVAAIDVVGEGAAVGAVVAEACDAPSGSSAATPAKAQPAVTRDRTRIRATVGRGMLSTTVPTPTWSRQRAIPTAPLNRRGSAPPLKTPSSRMAICTEANAGS